MKIIVNTENSIPLEIGKLNFSVDFTDESIKKYQEEGKKVLDSLKSVKNKDLDNLKDSLKTLVDFFLGDGAFEKIYKEYPSVFTCSNIATQLMINIAEELEARGKTLDNNEKIQSYLKKNNK